METGVADRMACYEFSKSLWRRIFAPTICSFCTLSSASCRGALEEALKSGYEALGSKSSRHALKRTKLMTDQRPKLARLSIVVRVAAGLVLTLALSQNAPAQQPTPPHADDEVKVKGAFDDDDGVRTPGKSETPQQVEVKKRYSPYAGRKYQTRVFFGDTHNHTSNSGDAFMAGNRLSPEQAYRFARGEEVVSSSGVPAKLSRPLDFDGRAARSASAGKQTQVVNQ
jgi:hypothetical protein